MRVNWNAIGSFCLLLIAVGPILTDASEPRESEGSGKQLSGTLLRVDMTSSRLWVKLSSGHTLQLPVGHATRVTINGSPARWEDLTPGQSVAIETSRSGYLLRVDVRPPSGVPDAREDNALPLSAPSPPHAETGGGTEDASGPPDAPTPPPRSWGPPAYHETMHRIMGKIMGFLLWTVFFVGGSCFGMLYLLGLLYIFSGREDEVLASLFMYATLIMVPYYWAVSIEEMGELLDDILSSLEESRLGVVLTPITLLVRFHFYITLCVFEFVLAFLPGAG